MYYSYFDEKTEILIVLHLTKFQCHLLDLQFRIDIRL